MNTATAVPSILAVPASVQSLTHRELVELFRRLNGGTAGFDTGRYKKAELLDVAAAWLRAGVPAALMSGHADAIAAERAAANVRALPPPPAALALQPPAAPAPLAGIIATLQPAAAPAPMVDAQGFGIMPPGTPPAPVVAAPQPAPQPDAVYVGRDAYNDAQPPAQPGVGVILPPAPQPAAAPAPDDIRAAILNAINVTTPQPAAAPAAAPMPAPMPQPDDAAMIAAALAETARTHPAAALPPMQDVPLSVPATDAQPPPGASMRRELFKDLPPAIVAAIPATLTLPVFNHPQAEKPSASFRWTAALLVPCLIAMASSPTQRVWFGGPSATGKTEMARQLAARTGRALFRVNFDRYTEASGIIGDMGLVNGDTRWVDGPVAAACRHAGAVLLLDELTYGTPGAISCLNPVLERDGTPLRLPRTGEALPVPASLFIIVADNTFGTGDSSGEYHARNEIGVDTRSRFQYKLAFDYLPMSEERAILRESVFKETGRKPSPAALAPLMKILEVSRQKASQGELQGAPSLRGAVAFASLLAHGVAPADAFTITIVNGAPDESHEALRQVFAAHWPTDATGALSAFAMFAPDATQTSHEAA